MFSAPYTWYGYASAGRHLVVQAPGVAAEVTGTLFSVEVMGDGGQVTVARGAVTVRTQAQTVAVRPGQTWTAGRLEPTPAPVGELLREHDASVLPPRGE